MGYYSQRMRTALSTSQLSSMEMLTIETSIGRSSFFRKVPESTSSYECYSTEPVKNATEKDSVLKQGLARIKGGWPDSKESSSRTSQPLSKCSCTRALTQFNTQVANCQIVAVYYS